MGIESSLELSVRLYQLLRNHGTKRWIKGVRSRRLVWKDAIRQAEHDARPRTRVRASATVALLTLHLNYNDHHGPHHPALEEGGGQSWCKFRVPMDFPFSELQLLDLHYGRPI